MPSQRAWWIERQTLLADERDRLIARQVARRLLGQPASLLRPPVCVSDVSPLGISSEWIRHVLYTQP